MLKVLVIDEIVNKIDQQLDLNPRPCIDYTRERLYKDVHDTIIIMNNDSFKGNNAPCNQYHKQKQKKNAADEIQSLVLKTTDDTPALAWFLIVLNQKYFFWCTSFLINSRPNCSHWAIQKSWIT